MATDSGTVRGRSRWGGDGSLSARWRSDDRARLSSGRFRAARCGHLGRSPGCGDELPRGARDRAGARRPAGIDGRPAPGLRALSRAFQRSAGGDRANGDSRSRRGRTCEEALMDQRARNLSTSDLANVDDRARRDRAPADADAEDPREESRQKAARTAEQVKAPIEERAMLLPEPDRLRLQWSEIQGTFVDSPRQAVERADALVADVMKRMAEIFATERANLEQQWD